MLATGKIAAKPMGRTCLTWEDSDPSLEKGRERERLSENLL